MKKHHFLFLLFAFLFLSGQALAQTGPPIFVSTFAGNQILSVDGTTGATTVIHTGLIDFLPEDIVVGPDGKIYICDPAFDKIWRLNPNNTLEVETIYTKAGPDDPSGPEGPSFINDDLFFNTRDATHTGVWKIAGVATIPFTGTIPPPVNLIDAGGTGSTFGEGTAFDRLGNLLIVDRSNSRVLRASAPTFASAPVLIPNPTDPAPADLDLLIGVAVNSKNEIFVASQERGPTFPFPTSDGKIQRFDSDGNFLGTFVSFTAPDAPHFLEFDASDNLFVVTGETAFGQQGKVWRVNPLGAKTPLVDLSVAFATPTTPPDLASNAALGLAVPATETSETLEFTDAQKDNTYDFGSHKFKLNLNVKTGRTFKVKITAKDVRPKDLKSRLDPNVFPPGSDCVRFPGKGGKCVVYQAEGANGASLPLPEIDFAGDIDIVIKYFDNPLLPAVNPRMAHAFGEPAGADFTEDMTTGFDPSPNPDDPADPALSGRTTRWSEFVAVDANQVFLQIEIDIKPGSFPNSIKLSGNGAIPVAIFSTPDFDATTVDPFTVVLNSASVRIRGKGLQAHAEDVNGDGLLDLVVQIDRGAFISLGDGIGLLTGRTLPGDFVFGTDSVRVIE